MQNVSFNLKYCYGIKELSQVFDFSKTSVYAIYAANGTMKSSFARSMKDLSLGQVPKDSFFPLRVSSCDVKVDGVEIDRDSILVINPYEDSFSYSENASTLLISETLKREYEALSKDVDAAKKRLLDAIKSQSGTKSDIEKSISVMFQKDEKSFQRALLGIEAEVLEQTDFLPSEFPHDRLMDEKLSAVFALPEVQEALKEYIERQNTLLDQSVYFKRGVFNFHSASSVAGTLDKAGYFSAKHGLLINDQHKIPISSKKDLENLISLEKEKIVKDPVLAKKMGSIEKALGKNEGVRELEEFLSGNPEIIQHLSDFSKFRESVWKIHLNRNYEAYKEYTDKVKSTSKRRKEIEDLAKAESGDWEDVIRIFNDRFFVPFQVEVKNKIAVTLGSEQLLSVGFRFKDGTEEATVERGELVKSLSQGEKKALYILNILFEIRRRAKDSKKTLLIIDDVADSFDYRNKYAIIQYLTDISKDPNFNQIVLTHNFDFFRTINQGRLVNRNYALEAVKGSDKITLRKSEGVNNIFTNSWQPGFHKNRGMQIASIPFIRNIVEYTKGFSDPDYLKLTSMLHVKPDTAAITLGDLDDIFGRTFTKTKDITDREVSLITAIFQQAEICLGQEGPLNLEKKVVLSIAIRHMAEMYIQTCVTDKESLEKSKRNQTTEWFDIYCKEFPSQPAISILERVVLMTPENLHLNAFMYEPLLDMSDEHLQRLYHDVKGLGNSETEGVLEEPFELL